MDQTPRLVDLTESRIRRHPQRSPGEALGSFVRQTRESRRLSQARAAELAALSKTTWQQIEGGAGEAARNTTVHAVARALGIDPAILLSLRDGLATIDEAHTYSRSRVEVIANIERLFEWLRLSDLYALEEQVLVRAELRRLQRSGEDAGSHE